MRIAAVWAVCWVIATAGCDKVFRIEDHGCTRLNPDLDEDGDQQLNGVDACPTVPYQPDDDEDGDTDLDACDLCPQLAGDPGDDRDCDGLGARCDPDDDVPHERRFYGFHSPVGFSFEDPAKDGMVDAAAGQLHFALHINNTTSAIYMDTPGAALASYEVAGTIQNARTTALHWDLDIEINDAAAHEYEVLLQKSSSSDNLSITIESGSTELERIEIGKLEVSEVSFVIRGEVTADGIAGAITVNGITHTIAVPAAVAPVVGPVTYGVYAYRDRPTVDNTTDILIDYFIYTADRP